MKFLLDEAFAARCRNVMCRVLDIASPWSFAIRRNPAVMLPPESADVDLWHCCYDH